MKKIKLNIFALSLFSALALTSCNDDDQDYVLTGNAPVGTLTSDKSTITEMDDDTTIDEENVASYTFTMDKPYKTNMKFKVELVGGESTGSAADFETSLGESGIDNGSDGFLINVPANTTTFTFTMSAIFDDAAEGTETLRFKITPAADMNGVVDANSQYFNLNIVNSTSDNLDISLDWQVDKTYTAVDGTTGHSYSDFDFDLEIYYFGSPVLTSYSSAPESIEFLSSYPDGTFTVTASLWTVAAAAEPMLPIAFKPTLKVVKKGIFVKEFDLTGNWNSAVGGADDGNANAYVDVCKFTKSGSTYQVLDMDDNVLVTGKLADVKNVLSSFAPVAKRR